MNVYIISRVSIRTIPIYLLEKSQTHSDKLLVLNDSDPTNDFIYPWTTARFE